MLKRFKNQLSFFETSSNDSCLLAVSGGVDSMVLTDLFRRSNISFSIAHCNFNLRGEESSQDAAFVKSIAKKITCNYFEANFTTKYYSKFKKYSIQMAARELRYSWLNELSKIHGFSKILTAHHLDDSFETFMINLLRGTGLKGLLGIPIQKNIVMRPMLDFTKTEIINYAKKNKVKWREDSSNKSLDYYRNQIRHDVITKLKTVEPNFLQNFKETIKNLSYSYDASLKFVKEFKEKYFRRVDNYIMVDTDALKSLTPIDFYLFELFSEFGFTDLKALKLLPNSQSGKYLESKTHRLVKNRKTLILTKRVIKANNKNYFISSKTRSINKPLVLNFDCGVSVDSLNQNQAFLSLTKLNFPLVIRKWSSGDFFYPTGMDGKKMISKYFKDQKFSKIEKENQWLLCSGDDIVWVIGKRCDRRYAAKRNTSKTFLITLKSKVTQEL